LPHAQGPSRKPLEDIYREDKAVPPFGIIPKLPAMFSSWFDASARKSTGLVPADAPEGPTGIPTGAAAGKSTQSAKVYDLTATSSRVVAARFNQYGRPNQDLSEAASAAAVCLVPEQQLQEGVQPAPRRPTILRVNREIGDQEYFAIMECINSVPKEITLENPYAPKDPLHYANPLWRYKPVDPTKFLGYWHKCVVRSTPPPFPIFIKMGMSKVSRMLVESVSGILLQLTPDKKVLEMRSIMDFVPSFLVAMGADYCEPFPLDGSKASWYQRRDLVVGKHIGQIFMTTDDILILRVYALGLISKKPDWVSEDYIHIEPDGKTIVVRPTCRDPKKPSRESWQYLVGEYQGPHRPAKAK